MPSPTLPATLTRPQWLRLGALLLAALWLTMGLLGFLLLNKQHQLMLDLAVSRAAVIAGDIDATLQTAQRSGLTLDETQSLQSLLQRLQGDTPDLARIDIFRSNGGAASILYSSDARRIGSAAQPAWQRLSLRDKALWQIEAGNGRIEAGRRISDAQERNVGGYVLTIDARRYYHQTGYSRTVFLQTLFGTALGAGLLLLALLWLLAQRPGGRLRTRILGVALPVMLASGIGLSLHATRLFSATLQPALEAKAASVADFTRAKLARALALGIPLRQLVGIDDYFATLLAKHPELAAIRLDDVQQQALSARQTAGAIGLTLTRPLLDPDRPAQLLGQLQVSTAAGFVASQMQALAADIAIVLLVGLIVFNEALSALLGRLPATAGIAPDAAVRSGRLAAIRLPLFLFILTEELTRAFLPLHIRELVATAGHAGQTTLIGLPISVYMLCFAVATPLAGGLADRHGAGRIFTAGAALSAAGFVWAALTDDLWQFALARACCATGYALATMACQRAILADSDQQSRAQGLAMFIGAVGIAAICGSSIGGVLAERAGVGAVLSLSALLCLIATALFARIALPRTIPGDEKPFAWIDLLRLLRQRRFAMLMLGGAIPAKIALAGLLFYLTPLALAAAGYAPAAIGRAVMVYFILITCVTPLAARWSDRYRLRLSLVVVGGMIIGGGALAGWNGGVAGTLIGIVALGIGTGLSAAALQALANEVGTADGSIGVMAATAAFRTIERIGSAIGPLLAGTLLLAGSYGSAMAAIGGVLLLGALLLWLTFGLSQMRRAG